MKICIGKQKLKKKKRHRKFRYKTFIYSESRAKEGTNLARTLNLPSGSQFHYVIFQLLRQLPLSLLPFSHVYRRKSSAYNPKRARETTLTRLVQNIQDTRALNE